MAGGSGAAGRESGDGRANHPVPVQKDQIKAKLHPKSMYTLAGLEEQTLPGRQIRLPQETPQTPEEGVGEGSPVSQAGTPGQIGNAQGRQMITRFW